MSQEEAREDTAVIPNTNGVAPLDTPDTPPSLPLPLAAHTPHLPTLSLQRKRCPSIPRALLEPCSEEGEERVRTGMAWVCEGVGRKVDL